MAKAKRILPKKIGGVKIPKRLRRLGDEVLAHPATREALAGLVAALAAALAAKGLRGTRAGEALSHPVETAEAAGARASDAARDMAGVAVRVLSEVFEAVRHNREARRAAAHADGEEADDRVH